MLWKKNLKSTKLSTKSGLKLIFFLHETFCKIYAYTGYFVVSFTNCDKLLQLNTDFTVNIENINNEHKVFFTIFLNTLFLHPDLKKYIWVFASGTSYICICLFLSY